MPTAGSGTLFAIVIATVALGMSTGGIVRVSCAAEREGRPAPLDASTEKPIPRDDAATVTVEWIDIDLVNHEDLWRQFVKPSRQTMNDHIALIRKSLKAAGTSRYHRVSLPLMFDKAPHAKDGTNDSGIEVRIAALHKQESSYEVTLALEYWYVEEHNIPVHMGNGPIPVQLSSGDRKVLSIQRTWNEASGNLKAMKRVRVWVVGLSPHGLRDEVAPDRLL